MLTTLYQIKDTPGAATSDKIIPDSTVLPWYQRPALRSTIMGLGALLLYGGWAFAANYPHGFGAAIKAAATQGFISMTITVAVTAIMEFVVRRVSSGALQVIAPFAAAEALGVGYTITLHLLTGTPELLRTVLPVLSIGAVYCLTYSLNLAREARARLSD